MSPETKKQPKIPHLHFKPEQIVTEDDPEYFDELLQFLKSRGYDTKNLLYCGFDGKDIAKGEPVPKYPFIYAMNEAGWREALRLHSETPTAHAFGGEMPVLGLYDRTQLADARPHGIDLDEDYSERIEHAEIEKRENLSDLPADKIIDETVVHKDYPDASPTDALLGIVFLDRD